MEVTDGGDMGIRTYSLCLAKLPVSHENFGDLVHDGIISALQLLVLADLVGHVE